MSLPNEDRVALGRFGVALEGVVANLRPDGPTVDFELLVDFIDEALDAARRRMICERIVTFRAWYDAYLETLESLASEGAEEVEDDRTTFLIDEAISIEKQVHGYLATEYIDLIALLPSFVDAVRADPLNPYRPALRVALCSKWHSIVQSDDPALKDQATLTMTLIRWLEGAELNLPFPVALVAAILVKEGFERLCVDAEEL